MPRIRTTMTVIHEYDADPDHYKVNKDEKSPDLATMCKREEDWIAQDPFLFIEMVTDPDRPGTVTVKSEVLS